MPKVKPLSLLPLIALIFYDVSGGPFGIEVSCTVRSLVCWVAVLRHTSVLQCLAGS